MNPMLRFGLIAGTLLCILMFAPYFIFGTKPEWMKIGEIVGYTSMVLCLSATWFAMRREATRRGGLRFGSAFAIGAGVSAVAALVFGLATLGFYSMAGDALPEALMAFYQQQIRDSGASAESIEQQLQQLDSMRTLFFNRPLQAAVMAATVFVIGIIETLPAAWLVSRTARPSALSPTA
jgi:hypothetical protein